MCSKCIAFYHILDEDHLILQKKYEQLFLFFIQEYTYKILKYTYDSV